MFIKVIWVQACTKIRLIYVELLPAQRWVTVGWHERLNQIVQFWTRPFFLEHVIISSDVFLRGAQSWHCAPSFCRSGMISLNTSFSCDSGLLYNEISGVDTDPCGKSPFRIWGNYAGFQWNTPARVSRNVCIYGQTSGRAATSSFSIQHVYDTAVQSLPRVAAQ